MKVTPDIAAIYIKYINKNCQPKPLDKFDLLDVNGNTVSMLYTTIVELAKQSKHNYQKKEIESLTDIMTSVKDAEVKTMLEILELYENLQTNLNHTIIGLKQSIQNVEDMAKIYKPKIKRFKTIKPRSK